MNIIFTAAFWQTTGLLICSNIFMTFAWYGHLKNLSGRPWIIAALVSWGIALFEYLLQVPANRIGNAAGIPLGQLKVMQEIITLLVFAGFSVLYLGETLRWNHAVSFLFLCGAAFFAFNNWN